MTAATAWAAEEEVFKWAYLCADLDTLMDSHYTVFGYDRMWPGVDDIYEKVFKAVSTFNMNMASRDGLQTKISIINKAREAMARNEYAGPAPVPLNLYNAAVATQAAARVSVPYPAPTSRILWPAQWDRISWSCAAATRP